MKSRSGYSLFSIITHWLSAIAVLALFFTHEADRGTAAFSFHVAGGALIGVFLLWRVFWRVGRRSPAPPEQHRLLNLAARVVIFALLGLIVVVVVSGYLLPWSVGQPIDMGGIFNIPSPLGRNGSLHELFEELHEISGQLIMLFVLVHLIGGLKHLIVDRDGVFQRMLKPEKGGH